MRNIDVAMPSAPTDSLELPYTGRPQVTLAVTLEQSEVDRFADADKALVETLELSPLPKTSPINLTKPAAESAAKPGATTK